MRPGEKAWAGLGVGILAYNTICPEGETLSETVDAALERPIGRYLAIGALAITGAHLLNILPQRADPIHHMFRVIRHGLGS